MRIHPRLELEEEDEDGPFCGRARLWQGRGLGKQGSDSLHFPLPHRT